MELGLSLGDASHKPFPFMEKPNHNRRSHSSDDHQIGFLNIPRNSSSSSSSETQVREPVVHEDDHTYSSSHPTSLRLHLLPLQVQPPLSLLSSEPGSTEGPGKTGLEVNRLAVAEEEEEDAVAESSPSPIRTVPSLMEFCFYSGAANEKNTRGSSEGDEEEENGNNNRKKLRLSKEQSAFLEESFKEHHTLNPKQKLGLAKQLNLRPRQVEVWFQNRRARTKLKQTEVDCEYLKRWCETLTEENRRLQKELSELRALKSTHHHPLFMHLPPPTTLTMCPSCERVSSSSAGATTNAAIPLPPPPPNATGTTTVGLALSLAKPALPFLNGPAHTHLAGS